mgnify:FL=1
MISLPDGYFMLNINDYAVDIDSGEFVLITNQMCRKCAHAHPHIQCEWDPWEGLVFEMEGDKLKTWQMQNIKHRNLRKTTPQELSVIQPQHQARLEELRGKRKR